MFIAKVPDHDLASSCLSGDRRLSARSIGTLPREAKDFVAFPQGDQPTFVNEVQPVLTDWTLLHSRGPLCNRFSNNVYSIPVACLSGIASFAGRNL